MLSRRVFLAPLALLIGLALAPASANAAAPGAARVQLVECHTGKTAVQRSAIFLGEMSQIPEATQMRMRFQLRERVGRDGWRGVAAYGIAKWQVSKPSVMRLRYRESVLALKPGTRYRMKVFFQWLDGEGDLVANRQAESGSCRQPGKLPNLVIREPVRALPGPTVGTYRYVVRVRNASSVTSPASEVRLTVDGAEVDVRRLRRLGPGELRRVGFVGPACGSSVIAVVDPTDTVREVTQRDNTHEVFCPIPVGG